MELVTGSVPLWQRGSRKEVCSGERDQPKKGCQQLTFNLTPRKGFLPFTDSLEGPRKKHVHLLA